MNRGLGFLQQVEIAFNKKCYTYLLACIGHFEDMPFGEGGKE